MDHKKRVLKLLKILEEHGCDALIVEDPINLYYLTGLELSTGMLLAHEQGAHLIVDGRYYENAQKTSTFPVLRSDEMTLAQRLATAPFSFIKTLAFDSENTSFKRFEELEQSLSCALIPLVNPVATLRLYKDPEELHLLHEAAALGCEGFKFVCSLLKEGITEIEIARELDIFWKRKGSKALAFEPIIAFGVNGSMPHYRAGSTILKQNMPVLIDIGVNIAHYHSDMTRVVFFGTPDPKIQEIYTIVQESQKLALALCKPGVLISDVDGAARDYITSKGYGEYFSHGLGHGIGLQIHEAPSIRNKPPFQSMPLATGMVITIEPGIYLPGVGGVRFEDTIAITPEGHENLTCEYLKDSQNKEIELKNGLLD
jgi:Xaa-Pro aminopeptidase